MHPFESASAEFYRKETFAAVSHILIVFNIVLSIMTLVYRSCLQHSDEQYRTSIVPSYMQYHTVLFERSGSLEASFCTSMALVGRKD